MRLHRSNRVMVSASYVWLPDAFQIHPLSINGLRPSGSGRWFPIGSSLNDIFHHLALLQVVFVMLAVYLSSSIKAVLFVRGTTLSIL